EGLGGSDGLNLIAGRNDGAVTINFDGGQPAGGGTGNQTDVVLAFGTDDASDTFSYFPGASDDSGRLEVLRSGANAATVVNFTGSEQLEIDGDTPAAVGGTGDDVLNLNGTGGADSFTVNGTGTLVGVAQVNGGPDIRFRHFGSTSSDINLNGGDGDDQFVVSHPTNWQIGNVNVNGGLPTASDSFQLSISGADDTLAYTPTAANSGTLNVTSGGSSTLYSLAGVESAHVDALGQAAADALTVTTANATVTPGANPGEGTVDPVDANGNAMLSLGYAGVENVAVTGTAVVIQGTSENDTIRLNAAGIVTVTNLLGFNNVVDVSAFAQVIINAAGGDDVIYVEPAAGRTVNVLGGEPGSGSDVLQIDELSAPIVGGDFRVLPDFLNNLHDTGEVQEVNGGFSVRYNGIETLQFLSGDNNDSLQITDDLGDNVWTLANGPFILLEAAMVQIDNRTPVIVEGIGNLILGNQGGVDRFVVSPDRLPQGSTYQINGLLSGLPAQPRDTFELVGTGFGDEVTLTQTTATLGVSIGYADMAQVVVNSGEGDDLLLVDASTAVVTTPVMFDGGTGNDTLRVTGSNAPQALSATYTPGPGISEGRLDYDYGASDMSINFANLEPVEDNVPAATLTINGTAGDNHITYTAGPSGPFFVGDTTGLVAVDGFETIEFSRKTTLVINGGAGDDVINLNNPTTPTGMTGITVNGGDPSGSDLLIVNDRVLVNDNAAVTPTGQGAGTIALAVSPDVTYTGIEALSLVGQSAGDTFTINGTVNPDVFEYFSGSTPNTGTIRGAMSGGAFELPEISFSGMSATATRSFSAGLETRWRSSARTATTRLPLPAAC
ncbi:MAG: hypothetical protein R3C99_25830, partial [Pirellulaceae bacterium]